MKLEEFIEQVQERTHLSSKIEADRATRAALETLAECLSKKERYDAAAQLPRGLALYLEQPFLGPGNQPSPRNQGNCTLDEFFQRMGIREGVPPATAREHAHAVISILINALSRGEVEDIHRQLPMEFYFEFFEGL